MCLTTSSPNSSTFNDQPWRWAPPAQGRPLPHPLTLLPSLIPGFFDPFNVE